MQDYKKLRVWHAAVRFALSVVDAFPERTSRRVPGLRSQTIRAAISVHSNLVEGCGRAMRVELLRFVEVSIGSLKECEAHLFFARGARVLAVGRHQFVLSQLIVVRRMLISFQNTIQRAIAKDQAAHINRRSAA